MSLYVDVCQDGSFTERSFYTLLRKIAWKSLTFVVFFPSVVKPCIVFVYIVCLGFIVYFIRNLWCFTLSSPEVTYWWGEQKGLTRKKNPWDSSVPDIFRQPAPLCSPGQLPEPSQKLLLMVEGLLGMLWEVAVGVASPKTVGGDFYEMTLERKKNCFTAQSLLSEQEVPLSSLGLTAN